MDRLERQIFLGRTADGAHVTATVSLMPRDQTRSTTFTDHTIGLQPECVSVSFEVKGPHPRDWHVGHVPAHERIVTKPAARQDIAAFIELLSDEHHLNTMHAECVHMTPAMLERRDGESAPDWQTRMLADTVCPETGYRWGSAWLAERVPADVLEKTGRLIATGTL